MKQTPDSDRRPKPNRRTDNLHLRISSFEKELLWCAAERLCLPLSEFVRAAALRDAKLVRTVAERLAKGDLFD